MIIGIDASNIRGGGGITHLVELLEAADPTAVGFERVIVWGGRKTLRLIPKKNWLIKQFHPWLERNLIWRSLWQYKWLSQLAREAGCAVIFVPGGSYVGNFHPCVTISQNMLPFEWGELKRFGFSGMLIKLVLLGIIQKASFKRSDGLIFLTRYAQQTVLRHIGGTSAVTNVISHGIAPRFLLPVRQQLAASEFSNHHPFRLLYVSIIDVYKHQDNVSVAVGRLREEGIPVRLDLVGPAYGPALSKLQKVMNHVNRSSEVVRYRGPIDYTSMHECYAQADVFVFASSCENLPIILLEGMAAGLPIACSERGPMAEVLGEGGLFFDPESVDSIAEVLCRLFFDRDLRQRLAQLVSQRASQFSWENCADQTFKFLARTARQK